MLKALKFVQGVLKPPPVDLEAKMPRHLYQQKKARSSKQDCNNCHLLHGGLFLFAKISE